MTFNQTAFDEALKRKYDILQQNADTAATSAGADTTRANAAMLGVQQQQGLQDSANTAAMARAQLNADTSLQTTGMNNQSALGVANLNNQGANYRAGLTTDAQRYVAGMENQLGRDRMAQQNAQFGQTFGLDTAKAQEQAIQGRAVLGRPEYGTPAYDYKKERLETAIKRPAITGLAPSPLSTLGGQSGIASESDDTLRKVRERLNGLTGNSGIGTPGNLYRYQ